MSLSANRPKNGVYVVSTTQVDVEGAKCVKFENRPALARDHDSEIYLSLEYKSFFLTFVPHSIKHVTVEQDQRGFDDLLSTFPAVDANQLKRFWENSSSWEHCISVLSSLLSDKNSVYISSNQFDVLSNEQAWPVLARDIFSDSFAGMSLEESGGWTLCSVTTPTHGDCSEQEWEMIDLPTSEASLQGAAVTVVSVTPSKPVSYRDALLQNVGSPGSKATSRARSIRTVQPWRPVFVLEDPVLGSVRGNGKRGAPDYEDYGEDDNCSGYQEYSDYKSAALSARLHCAHVRNSLKRIHVDKIKSLRCKY